jgi:oligoribonuclease NrnB/cAMP/cGMP phosphodiesterase (DHH superfamily)
MKCFYHTDMDGICSAAIVKKFYNSGNIEFIPMNYNKNYCLDNIVSNELILIVDFSFKKEVFDQILLKTTNIIWIDHHKTAIDQYSSYKIKGIRQDGIAGCVLVWQYFFKENILPTIVEMLGHYDVWNFSKYGDELTMLQAGIRLKEHSPDSKNWDIWLNYQGLLELIEQGRIALEYRTNCNTSLVKAWSFFADFEGYKAVCCNVGSTNSQLFDSVIEEYDLMIPFVFDGEQWTVSVYTKKEDIDCAEIAKKYGGGGHKKAAGFTVKDLPFHRVR